jgi:hypothetical protein
MADSLVEISEDDVSTLPLPLLVGPLKPLNSQQSRTHTHDQPAVTHST